MLLSLNVLLKSMVEQGGFDFYIMMNLVFQVCVDGVLCLMNLLLLMLIEMKQIVYLIFIDNQKYCLEEDFEIDFLFGICGLVCF